MPPIPPTPTKWEVLHMQSMCTQTLSSQPSATERVCAFVHVLGCTYKMYMYTYIQCVHAGDNEGLKIPSLPGKGKSA